MSYLKKSLKNTLLLCLLVDVENVYACSMPLGDIDKVTPDQEVVYMNYGKSNGFVDRSIDTEMYCWGSNIYTGASLAKFSTPGMPMNYAMYWQIGWAGTGRTGFFAEYGMDFIEFARMTLSGIFYQSSNISLDQRMTAGFIWRISEEHRIRFYYRYYRLNGPLVTDGHYAYYGISYGGKL